MEKEHKYSVITGDIVNSSNLDTQERALVLEFLKELFISFEKQEGRIANLQSNYAIARGDSFQVIFQNSQNSFRYSILLRAGLRSLFQKDLDELCDARISIGIGTVDYWGDTISESDGDAFRCSGRNLDKAKNRRRFLIELDDKELNEELNVYLMLLDAIINDWTYSRSQIVYEKLLEPKQLNIAKKMGLSASAISKRLNSAHWDAIDVLLNRFETKLK